MFTGRKPAKFGRRRFMFRRKKYCKFCETKAEWIDYKDVRTLQGYVPSGPRSCRAASPARAPSTSAN